MENIAEKRFLISFFLFVILACENIPEQGGCETYIIQKNEHYAEGYFPVINGLYLPRCSSTINFSFVVDESMFYDPSPPFVNGHNKIRGFVLGKKGEILAQNILKYSARITWRCRSIEELDIGLIVHLPVLENHIQEILLKDVQVGDEIFCIIEDRSFEGFYFYVENLNTSEFAEKIISKYGAHDSEVYGLLESPYFGGQETAPNKVHIKICTR